MATAILTALPVGQGNGQVVASGSGDIVRLDFAQAPLGPVLRGFAREGTLDVVDHNGLRMLRATSRATFLVRLTSVLPTDFTLEIDLVPKECCQPEDIAIEGTPTIDQGDYSANIVWRHADFRVVGGGPYFDQPVPEDIAVTLPGQLTNIVLTFRGDELSAYTNGRLLYTLPNRKFVRGRVLRVFLGGQNDSDQAVYLARLRVVQGVVPPVTAVAVSTNPGVSAGPRVPGQSGPLTAGQTAATGILSGTQSGTAATQPSGTTGTTATSTSGGATQPTGSIPAPAPQPTSTSTTTTVTLAPRNVSLTGFSATGTYASAAPSTAVTLAPRTVLLAGFLATGTFASTVPSTTVTLAPRTVSLSGFSATGGFTSLAPRRVALSGFSGIGVFGTLSARTVALSGFSAIGNFGSLAPRAVPLSGFSATGVFSTLAPRTILLSGFTVSGSFPMLAPRTIPLTGFGATGVFVVLPPRSITLPGWTATGIKTP